MLLVKYSCGCVGFPPDGHPEGAMLLTACDVGMYDDDGPDLFRRKDVVEKQFEELDPKESAALESELKALLRDGYALRSFKLAMERCDINVSIGTLKRAVNQLAAMGGA